MKKIQYDFGQILIYDNFLVEIINDGFNINLEHFDILFKLGKTHFLKRPFGYISYRIHSYSINPMIYKKTSEIENLVAIAVVSNGNIPVKRFYKVEELFFNGSIKIFDGLANAQEWVQSKVIERERNNPLCQVSNFKENMIKKNP